MLQIISLLIFATAIILSVLNYLRFSSDYTQKSAKNVQQLVEQVSKNVENYLDGIAQLCSSPYYSSSVMSLLDRESHSEQEALEKRREIEGYLQQVMMSPRKDIIGAYIISDAIYYNSRTGHSSITNDYTNEQWYLDALSSDESILLSVHPEQIGSSSRMVVSVVKQIRSLQDNDKTLGVIRIDANYSGIKEICDRISVNPGGALFIADTNGNLIYSNSLLPSSVTTEQIHSSAKINDFCIQKFHGTNYIINSQTISNIGWQVIEVNNKAEITKEAQATLLFSVIFTVGMAVLGVVISAFFINKHLNPLYKTIKLMEKVENGDLSVRADTNCYDEIAYLNGEFNSMLTRIQEMVIQENQLTKEIYEAKYLQRQAQYEALQRQIQPHFLFNTLGTISTLAKCDRSDEVISGIDQLATLLRGIVNAGKEISLEAELKITESYLRLQQLRNEALTYDICTDEVDLSYQLPALTIQPIVENAITHGCGSLQEGADIKIDMWYEGDRLIISVYDNGSGIEPEVLSLLEERLSTAEQQGDDASSSGIALVNIQARIRHKFGGAYGIHVQSEIDGGTAVTLILPRRS
ncbi:MAG: histidine kinase [Oscillospiraceae bacterium]|nr:histidine kinase [Oscillospiraceae bacterium]